MAGTTCQPEEAADWSWFCVLLRTIGAGPAMSCFNLKSTVVSFVISCHVFSPAEGEGEIVVDDAAPPGCQAMRRLT